MTKISPPAINKKSFNCPFCGAFAHQVWHEVLTNQGNELPVLIDYEAFKTLEADLSDSDKQRYTFQIQRSEAHSLWLEKNQSRIATVTHRIFNTWISRCVSCYEAAIWIHDALIHPNEKFAIAPNDDLPIDVKADFEEAGKLIDISPRSCAALLRLCIQKICEILTGNHKADLNANIGTLVAQGLPNKIQQALDIVRVTGNNAVHPGVMDIKDNKDVAIILFDLINLIADELISKPKRIAEMYDKLPDGAKAAIEKRDQGISKENKR